MEFDETCRIEAPIDDVWALLSDVEVVADCFPGVELQDADGDEYSGTMVLKFGPTTARFGGQAQIVYGDDRDVVLRARGRDARGATKASAEMRIDARAEGETTVVAVAGDVDVVGPLAQFARTGGLFVTRQLLADFAACLGERAVATRQRSAAEVEVETGERVTAPSTPAVTDPPTAPSVATGAPSGFALLWQAVKLWFRDRRRVRAGR